MIHKDVIARQGQQLHDAVAPLIGDGQAYALVDFPNYANIGDSAIWLGALELLKFITGRAPSYICTRNNYDGKTLAKACPEGPIFIIGGGNFGDLYQPHQNLRLSLMRDFPGRAIVQLPQSIHFVTTEALAVTAKAIEDHGNFHMFVRDQASADIARENFSCPVKLAPDCAFCIGPLKRTEDRSGRFVFLRRLDKEATGKDYAPLQFLQMPEFDWATEPPLPRSLDLRAGLRAAGSGDLSASGLIQARSNVRAEYRMRRGMRMLSAGDAVLTDRLHGFIISVLLGLPVVAFDNSTKKVSAYQKLWMPDFSGAAVVATAKEALDKLGPVQRAYMQRKKLSV